jgi:hypothetical protein
MKNYRTKTSLHADITVYFPTIISILPPKAEPFLPSLKFMGKSYRLSPHRFWVQVETGAPAYDPVILLTIILYTYSRGIVSSRKIERVCRYGAGFA